MAVEEASDSFSVTGLDVDLPSMSPSAYYDAPLSYDAYRGAYTFDPYSLLPPTTPGRIDSGSSWYFHGDDWEEQARDPSLAKERRFAKIGLHCYNLEKGTNFLFLGLHEYRYTSIFSRHVTFEAEDPIRSCTHRFETHALYAPKHKGSFTVTTEFCTMVPPAPEEESYRCDFSNLALDDSFKGDMDDSFKGDMPDWLPEDALTASTNKLQYYEMKESEVEEEDKEWLRLYAELALLSKVPRYEMKEPFERAI